MNTNTQIRTNFDWAQVIRPALASLAIFTVVLGLVYPAAITGIAQAIFPHQANGSLITDANGTVIGSELIGQQFSDPAYFWGRLSATSPESYNAAGSTGSNMGPLNPALVGEDGTVQQRIDALNAADAAAGVDNSAPIPVDLVTASASGLDPQVSPAAAQYQVARVSALRGVSEAEVQALVDQHTEGRLFGLFGEPRVNVLELNLALDEAFPLSSNG